MSRMHTLRTSSLRTVGWRWSGILGLGLLTLAPAVVAPAARADDEDPTDVGLAKRVRELELEREREHRPQDGVSVGLRLGEARFARELARVDVTLEATNTNGQTVEWERAFPMDARAEVIRCSLQRGDGPELVARTLTFEDGRRLYGEASRGVRPTPGRDPLRVERQKADELRVTVFPVAAGETVRVRIAFVTPLVGTGRERVYTDPLWLDVKPVERHAPPPVTPGATLPFTLTSLVVEPGSLAYDRMLSPGMEPAPTSGVRLAFRPEAAVFAGSRTQVSFLAPDGLLPALAVRGGGLGTRVAVWRFDPDAFLAGHGLSELRGRATFRLTGTTGFTQRVVPGVLAADAVALPLSARVLSDAQAVTYAVEVTAPGLSKRFEVAEPLARLDADEPLGDAVTAWYRASMARHVLRWAGGDVLRLAKAVGFAVDLGVLLPGTAALAIPPAEQRALSPASRRTYRKDGALLGAPEGEADWIQPPAGSIR